MNVPPWLISPDMYVTHSVTLVSVTSPQIVPADPTRIYLAIFHATGGSLVIYPDGFETPTQGYQIPNFQNFLEFTYATHPSLVNMGWNASVAGPASIQWLQISWKPETYQ